MTKKRKRNPEKLRDSNALPVILGVTAVVGLIFFLGESKYSPIA